MADLAWGERLLVVGTGLIGTSVALAARAAGADVQLADADAEQLALAVRAGAGRVTSRTSPDVDVVVIAIPPRAVGRAAAEMLDRHPSATVTHVCSVQSLPQADVEASGADLTRYVGGHPVAGRETSGPANASADLFTRRPWVICPARDSGQTAVDRVTALAADCGAMPVLLDASTHDAALARLSHVPQLVASALAGSINGLDPARVTLAGTGLRDTTRLADSDPGLWTEIVTANAAAIASGLREVGQPLLDLAGALESGLGPDVATRTLLSKGRQGRSLLPGKHGGAQIDVRSVQVVVPDEPGALARLLGDIAAENVNLEDMRVEHASGQPLGIVDVVVLSAAYEPLVIALRARGWAVTS